MNPVTITTSWDDGHKLDLKLARMLKRHDIKATFYISPQAGGFPSAQRLTAADIRHLAQDFEIGAHTMTHPRLSQVDAATAWREITTSKETLERITGRPVSSFCYPYGDYSQETKRLVRAAGFSSARSIRRFVTRSSDQMAVGTSVDVFDHRRDGMLSVLRLCDRRPWRVFSLRRWDNLGKVMFAQARDRGEVFHLWGHSHEIEAHNLWQRLEEFLGWLREQPDAIFACNADVPVPPPRLLVASPYFKPRGGGLEEYAYQIAKGLQDNLHWRVAVVTSGHKEEVKADHYQGLKIYRLAYKLKLSNTPLGLGWSRALRHIVALERPDLIVAHSPVPGMLEVAARRAKKTPFVVTYHFGSLRTGNGRLDMLARCYERLVLPHVLRKAKMVICASSFVQHSALLAPYADKTVVIHPSVDTDLFKPGSPRERGHRILHLGGLKTGERHKGLETSLRVTAELRREYRDVCLAVVGDGDRQSYFAALAEQLGIGSHVDFRGRLAGEDLVAAYQAADVVLTPSRRESFGMVLVEAMACGVPVVASAVDGIPDVVQDGESGFLAEPDDLPGFARKIRELFDDAELSERFGQNGRRCTVMCLPTWARQVERTAEILGPLL